MIDLIFVALMQAAAGDPTTPPATAAQTAPAQQTTQQTGAQADRHALRCHREPIIGTRISRRVCLSDAERQQIENDSREQLQQMQRTGGTNAG